MAAVGICPRTVPNKEISPISPLSILDLKGVPTVLVLRRRRIVVTAFSLRRRTFAHRMEPGVMWERKCRVRRAFRRTIRFIIRIPAGFGTFKKRTHPTISVMKSKGLHCHFLGVIQLPGAELEFQHSEGRAERESDHGKSAHRCRLNPAILRFTPATTTWSSLAEPEIYHHEPISSIGLWSNDLERMK